MACLLRGSALGQLLDDAKIVWVARRGPESSLRHRRTEASRRSFGKVDPFFDLVLLLLKTNNCSHPSWHVLPVLAQLSWPKQDMYIESETKDHTRMQNAQEML